MAKQNYIRLAQSLLREHKYDSVVKVLDRGIELFPPNKFPFDNYTVVWADFYYKAGEVEKGNELVKQIAQRYQDDLSYYGLLSDKHSSQYQEDIQEAMYTMQSLIQVANQNNQKELAKELEESFYANVSSLKLQ